MSKSDFIPPPPVDGETIDKMLDAISDMTEADWDQLRHSAESNPYIREKYIQRLKLREKAAKKQRIREWWWSSGIQLANLLLALIAAITGIIALLR